MTDVLDLQGLNCPLPVLRTQKALRMLPAGAEIVVQCTDPLAAVDIPHFLRAHGHDLLGQGRDGAVLSFRIRRGQP